MSQEHYFSADPSAPSKTSEVFFKVGDKEFNLQAASGTFSATKLDPGTRVLLQHHDLFPDTGDVLDLGCGWGAISISIATFSPETTLWGLDVNQRSLNLTQANAKRLHLGNVKAVLANEIPSHQKFDAIWSNPPIRVGKAVLHDLLLTWIPRLNRGGVGMFVVAKQLGADSLQAWMQEQFPEFEISRLSTDKGFRVIRVISPATLPSK
jgi:16S rRNA (guanine1207-N2)-methyltransferase